MHSVDIVARAEMAQIKVRLHQMTTALQMSVNALDMALKASERIVETLSREPHRLAAEHGREEIDVLRQARTQILNMRMLLR
jgi:hypothetical protein